MRTLIATILYLGLAATLAGQETYVVEPLRIQPLAPDFAPVLDDSTLVFCSLRERDHLVGYRNELTDDPFSDLYRIDLRANGDLTPVLLGDAMTGDLNDGPATFTDGGRTICFTRNVNSDRNPHRSRDSDDRLGLFFSTRVGNGWTVPEPFIHNSTGHSLMHAALSADGQRLIFASDMPGGHGGYDLYSCDRDGDDWEIPVNLGPKVNGPGNEVFPFIAANGTLYFSSDREGGLGKLDILACRPSGGKWLAPETLPEPLNSTGNDIGYTSYRTDRTGYFSSDRDGNDRIYAFRRVLPLFADCPAQQVNNYCYQFRAPQGTVIPGLPLALRWDMGDSTLISGEVAEHCYAGPGLYRVRLDLIDTLTGAVFFSRTVHDLAIEDIHQPYITSVDTVRNGRTVVMNGLQSNLPGFAAEEHHWDLGDGSVASGSTVSHAWRAPGTYTVKLDLLGMAGDGVHLKSHCTSRTIVVIQRFEDVQDAPVVAHYQDAQGNSHQFEYQALPFDQLDMAIREGEDVSFSIELFASKDRISLNDARFTEVRKHYRVIERFDPQRGVFTYSVGDSKDLAGLYEVYRKVKELHFLDAEAVLINPEKVTDLSALELMSEAELDNTVVRDNAVYFQSGKADVSPAFGAQLMKVADLMKAHPGISMVIEAHTDAVGSNESNLKLSQRRAQAIVDHLVAKGIAKDRLVPVGHGENHPIASNDDADGRGLNRRVEFRIEVPDDQAYERRRTTR